MTDIYVSCYSGGHSSALCAIEAVRRYGKENVILLNHDISSQVEAEDIKRFKQEVADYLGLPITYQNHLSWEQATPIEVCKDAGAWKVGSGQILCTNRLKTAPFKRWLAKHDPEGKHIYMYGFDDTKAERARAVRREQIMAVDGYKTAFPLIHWGELAITDTRDIGIEPPMVYNRFKHANCIGCLKAGWQHWYIVFCERPDIWEEAKTAEDVIGYAIHKDKKGPVYLEDKEQLFIDMRKVGIVPTEHVTPSKFWHDAKKQVAKMQANISQCDLDAVARHDDGVCLDCMG
jgi:3'-phosphoadenosine 5'-phosphosulfate sulfotransferase (PAPS reductase)/FAD synthetase